MWKWFVEHTCELQKRCRLNLLEGFRKIEFEIRQNNFTTNTFRYIIKFFVSVRKNQKIQFQDPSTYEKLSIINLKEEAKPIVMKKHEFELFEYRDPS